MEEQNQKWTGRWFGFVRLQAMTVEWLVGGETFGLISPDHLRDLEVLQCSSMSSKELSGERIWNFSTSSRWSQFGSILSTVAPTRLSGGRGLEASPISITSRASVRGPSISTASLTPMPPISFRFTVSISSVIPSTRWLGHLSASVWWLFMMSVLGWVPAFSPAIMFINTVLNDFRSSIWFQPQSRVRTLHGCRPTGWFFRPALGLKGRNRSSQTGVKLAISSACLLEIDAHHKGRAAGTISSCGGLLRCQFASIATSCWSTAWGTSRTTRSPSTWFKRKRVLFSLLQRLVWKRKTKSKTFNRQ